MKKSAFRNMGLANSQLLTSLRVRGRPLWEFACLVGSSGALLARLREFTDLSTLHEYSLLVVRVHFWSPFRGHFFGKCTFEESE